MIFQINKKLIQIKNHQSGISLMLSILVLAAITAVTFSLATIVFIEVRSSGDLLRTEPALYATMGITEEALFQFKRFVNERENPTINIPPNPPALDIVGLCNGERKDSANFCRIGNVNLTIPDIRGASQPLDFDVTPTTITIFSREVIKIPLYTLNNFDLLYDQINLQLIANGINSSDYVKITLDVTAPDDSDPDDIIVDEKFSIDDSVNLTTYMNNDYQYDLIIDNTETDKNFLMYISSVGSHLSPDPPFGQGVPMGLPFVGKKALRVVANYLGLTRTFFVQIPIP